MRPRFNPFRPQQPNRVQSSSGNQQNSIAMHQQQQQQPPQMGMINPQISTPYNNSNARMPNMPPLLPQQPGFYNGFSHMCLPQMGFPPQGHLNDFNAAAAAAAAAMLLNQANALQAQIQAQAQMYGPNGTNSLPQQVNQNMGFSNLQIPTQSMINPAGVPVQVPNSNQGSQQMVLPQNPNLLPNLLFSAGQQVMPNQQNFGAPLMAANPSASFPMAAGQQQGQNSGPSTFAKQEGNPITKGQSSTSNSHQKNYPGRYFHRNPKRKASQAGHQKSQLYQMDNRKQKSWHHNQDKGKGSGHYHEQEPKFGCSGPTHQAKGKKRAPWIYSEKEIKRWRDERRRNYPSKANIEKKKAAKLTDSGNIDMDAKLRCEQLKEILAKQAELGVEVAEIPSHYLSDSKKRVYESEDRKRPLPKKGRFQNKYDSREKRNRRGCLPKNRKLIEMDSSNLSSANKREPTLLQKLLSADMRRDKRRLLQALRFMVLNSFFKDWPEKPLGFPLVVVKEDDGWGDNLAEGKFPLDGKDASEVGDKTGPGNFGDVGDSDKDDHLAGGSGEDDNSPDDNNIGIEHDASVDRSASFVSGKAGFIEEVDPSEEEGEIVD